MEIPTDFVAAVIIVNGLMQLVKKADISGKLNRFYPIVAEVLGLGIGLLIGLEWFESLFIGLSAMGIYRGVKVVAKAE